MVVHLVDTALVAAYPWVADTLEHCRSWRGPASDDTWYECKHAGQGDLRPIDVGGLRIKPHGHIGGKPLRPETSMWRNALLALCKREDRPDVAILARDLDGYPERREGMDQVRELPWPFQVVAAAFQPEAEAWFVAGFTPKNDSESGRLAALRAELSFDPILMSHRLTSHPNDARTDAKRVFSSLCGEDTERRKECLADPTVLRQRGALNGARAFLDEVDQAVGSLLRSGSSDAS